MRILLLTAEYPPQPGGVGDYTWQLEQALALRGCNTQVAVLRWRSIAHTLAQINILNPDILHIQYQTGAFQMRPAINLLPDLLRHLRPQLAVLVTAHDLRVPYLFPKATILRNWVTWRLLAGSAAVIVTNHQDYALLSAQLPSPHPDIFAARRPLIPAPRLIPIGSNIAVKPPAGYQRDNWRHSLGLHADDCLLLHFGLLTAARQLEQLPRLLELLAPHYKLLLVGGAGPTDADRAAAALLRQQAEQPALRGRINFTGYVVPEQVSAHLLAADIALLPLPEGASYRHGSLLAVLAHGLPLITTPPAQPLVPALIDRLHALLVPAHDRQALAQAVVQLWHATELRSRLAIHARQLAAQFDWQNIADQHLELYTSIHATRRH